jgi:ribonuclease P protein component
MPSHAFPADRRLRRRHEFQHVFDSGRRVHGRFVTVIAAPGAGRATRLGIVASRKLGGAVVRNRAKRLIREAFRNSTLSGSPVDLIVIPKAPAAGAAFADLLSDFHSVLRRGHVTA